MSSQGQYGVYDSQSRRPQLPVKSPSDWLDASVVLRFLLDDHPDHSPRAAALLRRAEAGEVSLALATHTLCEVVFVLEGQECSKQDISSSLTRFCLIRGVEVEDRDLVLTALLLYTECSVDFADALLQSIAANRGGGIWTFNTRHFQRMGHGSKEP